LRGCIEKALDAGHMTFEESALLQRRYEAGLASYTYLGREGEPAAQPRALARQPSSD
jgi:hypothetical protein